MKEYKYKCIRCKKDNISFLRIEKIGTVQEKAIFFCNFCRKEFSVEGIKAGYLTGIVDLLKKKYP